MAARAWSLLALTVASLGLAGCIDLQVFPAEIPADVLAPGWALDSSNTQSGTIGQEPIVKAHYHVNAYRDQGTLSITASTGPGIALIVSVPDAPIVDEQGEIQKRIDALMAENQVELGAQHPGTGTVGGQSVNYVVYDATVNYQGQRARGFAIDVPYKCGANGQNVRLFGYAVTAVQGLSGNNLVTWRELAGEAETGTLGGMLTAVRCS